MFKELQSKLKNSVFSIVTVIVFLNLFFTYFVYSSFLRDDFTNKSQQISEYITDYTKLQMNMIENDASRFCGENDIINSLNNPGSSIYDAIMQLKLTNSSIDSIFAFSYENEYFYTPLYSDSFEKFINYSREHNFNNIRQSEWLIFNNKYIGENSNFLVYMTKIKNDSNIPVGITAFIVNVGKLCYIQNGNNIFLENADCFLTVPDLTNSYAVNGAPINSIATIGRKAKKATDIYTKNYNSSVDINIQISRNQINAKLKKVVFVLTLVFVLSTLILYAVLIKYTSLISRLLTELTQKINNFKNRGEERTNE